MITCKDFWNHRSQGYDELVSSLYEEAYDKTVALSLEHLKPEDRVLEFACGTGIVTLRVAPHVSHLRAIDISNQMVEKAQAKAVAQAVPNVDISQLDLFDPSLEPGSFDAVMGFNVLCYLDNFDEVMERIRTLLKPDGVFLSATDCLGQFPTKVGIKKFWKSHTGSMPYVAFFTMKSLERKIAKAGFTVLKTANLFSAPPNLFVAAKRKNM